MLTKNNLRTTQRWKFSISIILCYLEILRGLSFFDRHWRLLFGNDILRSSVILLTGEMLFVTSFYTYNYPNCETYVPPIIPYGVYRFYERTQVMPSVLLQVVPKIFWPCVFAFCWISGVWPPCCETQTFGWMQKKTVTELSWPRNNLKLEKLWPVKIIFNVFTLFF